MPYLHKLIRLKSGGSQGDADSSLGDIESDSQYALLTLVLGIANRLDEPSL